MALRRHRGEIDPQHFSAVPPPELLPLDTYVERFRERYKKERTFRDIVHTYLGLTKGKQLLLFASRYTLPFYYRSATERLVQTYATKTYSDLCVAREAYADMQALEHARRELEINAQKVREGLVLADEVHSSFTTAAQAKAEAQHAALAAHTKQEEDLEAKLTVSRTEIVQQTDAEQIVRSALTAHLKRSPYLTVDSAGALTFDERKLVQRLESLFLTEIVDGIEQEEGRGFLTRARQRFEHVLSHWGEMEDLSEIAEVDWIESIILSRIRGYRVPVFPHFVVAKYEERPKNALGKKSVDTALAIDSSGSMDDNYRFEVAKKAAMATTALLRQLNPKNATYVSHFNNEVYDLSSPELLRQTNAGGGTRTEKALEWMIERLKDSGPSLAYLITDGDPNDVTATIAAAGKFKERPILLRIFLVDGNARTEEIIREIGRAAGPRTKVIPVRYDALGKDVLRDVSTSIGQMAEIAYF